MVRSALWLLVAGSIACSEPAAREPEEPECAECLGERTIEELIDLGSEPTGWWYKDGRSLPVDELKKRPRIVEIAHEASTRAPSSSSSRCAPRSMRMRRSDTVIGWHSGGPLVNAALSCDGR